MAREILFEGFSRQEILRLPAEQIEPLVLTGEPIVFSVGTARILGEFRLRDNHLLVTLAQIEGGGETAEEASFDRLHRTEIFRTFPNLE